MRGILKETVKRRILAHIFALKAMSEVEGKIKFGKKAWDSDAVPKMPRSPRRKYLKEYLELLSRLYIKSVRRYLDLRPTFIGITDAWKEAGGNAWRRRVETEWLTFDYPDSWRREIKRIDPKLKRKVTQRGTFKNLRSFALISVLENLPENLP